MYFKVTHGNTKIQAISYCTVCAKELPGLTVYCQNHDPDWTLEELKLKKKGKKIIPSSSM